ncbi:DUF4398 domain-containing protein [Lujinxingia vulgaris]|uniref:DUF4398 domain-containing protein n=1 Tax=Lujinxingia vulgaris TaxID=2600176 RepID=A0A5C6XEZ6_9DELT|nr:DUF4398 domain-containing protein [Lujinxingia vulgaris]TXD35998.1 DUF4398 domain-containing protein [Lujinxingia vulgaris]
MIPHRSNALSSLAHAAGRALLLVALGALLVGCGPIQATQRISEAEVAMERARVADADQHSPYEYTSAANYLYKAKEEWGYSQFEAAYDYATQARRAAESALINAREAPWPGHPVLGRDKSPIEADTEAEADVPAPELAE